MKDDDKVFDVAKPEKSKPDIGAKPMVVGHKNISIDPTLKKADGDDKNTSEPHMTHEKVVTPDDATLQRSDSTTTATDSQPASTADDADTSESDAQVSQDTNASAEHSDTDASHNEDATETTKDKQTAVLDVDELQVQREEVLQEITKSKKYHVPVHESGTTSI